LDKGLAEEQHKQALETPFQVITPENFYAHYPEDSNKESGRPSNVSALNREGLIKVQAIEKEGSNRERRKSQVICDCYHKFQLQLKTRKHTYA